MNKECCVLVCVTVQKDCGRLIEKGRTHALELSMPLRVLHVSAGKNLLGNPDAAEAMNYLYSLAREADAEMNILYDGNPAQSIARYAAAHGARAVILGQDKSGFSLLLQALLPDGTQLICDL